MISAVSNRGLVRFMLYDGALNADRFIAFLRQLGKDAGQKVFLILDNLKMHHATKLTTWVAAHGHAETPLPTYLTGISIGGKLGAPELNINPVAVAARGVAAATLGVLLKPFTDLAKAVEGQQPSACASALQAPAEEGG
jgi:hypothetical protein